jgi:hypothetical protein
VVVQGGGGGDGWWWWWRRRVVVMMVVAQGGGGGGWWWWRRQVVAVLVAVVATVVAASVVVAAVVVWWPAGSPAAWRVFFFLFCEILSAESHLCSRHMCAERMWRGSRQRNLCRLAAAEWPLPRGKQPLLRGLGLSVEASNPVVNK